MGRWTSRHVRIGRFAWSMSDCSEGACKDGEMYEPGDKNVSCTIEQGAEALVLVGPRMNID